MKTRMAKRELQVTVEGQPATCMKRVFLFFSSTLFVFASAPNTRIFGAEGFLDTSRRSVVQDYYNNEYQLAEDAQPKWTGDLSKGNAGDTSAEFKEAVRQRINWVRTLAGIPGEIVFDPVLNRKAQDAAMMVSSNGELNHNPPSTWTNYTSEGATAAGNSNLAIGSFGPEAITEYMRDTGSRNPDVGHRAWLLNPKAVRMATGDVPPSGKLQAANANWILGGFRSERPESRDEFIAWPPPGYFPYQLTAARWSLSYPNADFSKAGVSMTQNGVPIPVKIQARRSSPENMLVWVPGGVDGSNDETVPRPEVDVTNVVTVSNVVVGGSSKIFSYSVIIFDPALPPASVPPALGWTVGSSSLSAPAASEDTLYFQSKSGLTALEAATGTLRWALARGGIESTPVVGDSMVYIGESGSRGGLVAVDSATGDLKWFYFTGADVRSSAALGGGKVIYFGTGHALTDQKLETSGKLYCVDALTGGRRWEFQAGGDILSSPALGSNGLVYFTTALNWKDGVSTVDGSVYALRSDTGALVWKFTAGAEIENSPALDSGSAVYFGTTQGRFFCLDGGTGEKKWDFYTRGACDFSSPVIDSAGDVYFGTADRHLYALNRDGGKKWSLNIGAKVNSPPLVAGGDLLIILTDDGYVRAVKRSDGTLQWAYDTGTQITLSSPVLTDSGVLAFGTEDKTQSDLKIVTGKLFGFKGISVESAESPWPAFGQNARRTGSREVPSIEPPRIGEVIVDGATLKIPVFGGGEGTTLTLESSTDLRTWTKVVPSDPSADPSIFKIQLDNEQNKKFFRIVEEAD